MDNLKDGNILNAVLWKYFSGDNVEWALADFNDSEWYLVYPSLGPNKFFDSEWYGAGWYRLHFVVDSTLVNKPLALLIWQAGVSQLYLDGKSMYTFDSQRSDWTGMPRILILDDQKEHVLAVRYFNPSIKKFLKAGLPAGFYLALGDMDQMTKERIRYERPLYGYQIIFTTLSLAIGLLHLILFLFSPQFRQNFFFALFLLLYAAAIYFDYQQLLSTDIGNYLIAKQWHHANGLSSWCWN